MLLEEVVATADEDDDMEPWYALNNVVNGIHCLTLFNRLVNYQDIQLGEVIGTGSFGDVFAATYNYKKVAVKKLSRHRVTKQVYLELQTECAILRY